MTGRIRRNEPELQHTFLKTVERIETSHRTGIEELRTYMTADYAAIERRLLVLAASEGHNG